MSLADDIFESESGSEQGGSDWGGLADRIFEQEEEERRQRARIAADPMRERRLEAAAQSGLAKEGGLGAAAFDAQSPYYRPPSQLRRTMANEAYDVAHDAYSAPERLRTEMVQDMAPFLGRSARSSSPWIQAEAQLLKYLNAPIRGFTRGVEAIGNLPFRAASWFQPKGTEDINQQIAAQRDVRPDPLAAFGVPSKVNGILPETARITDAITEGALEMSGGLPFFKIGAGAASQGLEKLTLGGMAWLAQKYPWMARSVQGAVSMPAGSATMSTEAQTPEAMAGSAGLGLALGPVGATAASVGERAMAEGMTKAQAQALDRLTRVIGGGAVGGGVNAAEQLATTGEIDPRQVAVSAGNLAVLEGFGRPGMDLERKAAIEANKRKAAQLEYDKALAEAATPEARASVQRENLKRQIEGTNLIPKGSKVTETPDGMFDIALPSGKRLTIGRASEQELSGLAKRTPGAAEESLAAAEGRATGEQGGATTVDAEGNVRVLLDEGEALPSVLAHEAGVHAMKQLGLFKPKEWNRLVGWAREKYKDTEAVGDEEAVANQFQDWYEGREFQKPPMVPDAIVRLNDLVSGAFGSAGAKGRQVARQIAKGEMGRREPPEGVPVEQPLGKPIPVKMPGEAVEASQKPLEAEGPQPPAEPVQSEPAQAQPPPVAVGEAVTLLPKTAAGKEKPVIVVRATPKGVLVRDESGKETTVYTKDFASRIRQAEQQPAPLETPVGELPGEPVEIRQEERQVTPDAVEEGQQPEGRVAEYPRAEEQRLPAEAGGGYRAGQGGQVEQGQQPEEVTPAQYDQPTFFAAKRKREWKHADPNIEERLGETDDIYEAGFIAPGGKLLNMNRKSAGVDAPPHGETIARPDKPKTPETNQLSLEEAMADGFLRMDANAGAMHAAAMPDPSQLKQVHRVAKELLASGQEVIVQFDDPAKKRYDDKTYSPKTSTPDQVADDMVRFFDGLPIQKPRARFAAKRDKGDVWYSELERTLEKKMPNRAPSGQVRDILKTAKPEEVEWSGIDELLSSKPTVTKQEVLDHIRQNQVEVKEVIRGGIEAKAKDEARLSGRPKYGDYQLPGGKNYRELLLTLPGKAFTSENLKRNAELDRIRQWGTVEEVNRATDEQLELQKRMREEPHFEGPHWSEPNVLAHVRFNERTDKDGKRVLFIEEVQSDWHQRGKKEGYRSDEEGETLSGEATGGTMKSGAAPDAPFKKTWPDLAMKRMIRWAAENDFDRIAWTTGEQQADRYDLSKQIDSIRYGTREEDGKYQLELYKDGKRIHTTDLMDASELPNQVGKDVADKIVRGEGKSVAFGRKDLSGVDLKVGGEGMRGFYDEILPKTLAKYVKKWGATVGKTDLSESHQQRFVIVDDSGNYWGDASNSRDAMRQLEEDLNGQGRVEPWTERTHPGFSAHSIDITPAMRESVMQGQPLFAAKRNQRLQYFMNEAKIRGKAIPTGQPKKYQPEVKLPERPDLANQPPVNINAEQQKLAEKTGIPLFTSVKDTVNQYNPGEGAAKVKRAADPRNVIRQIAKGLDDKHGVMAEWKGQETSPFDYELKDFMRGVKAPKKMSKGERATMVRVEGLAGLIDAWTIDPKFAEGKAPDTIKYWLSKVPESEVKALREFGDTLAGEQAKDPLKRNALHVEIAGRYPAAVKRSWSEAATDAVKNLAHGLWDYAYHSRAMWRLGRKLSGKGEAKPTESIEFQIERMRRTGDAAHAKLTQWGAHDLEGNRIRGFTPEEFGSEADAAKYAKECYDHLDPTVLMVDGKPRIMINSPTVTDLMQNGAEYALSEHADSGKKPTRRMLEEALNEADHYGLSKRLVERHDIELERIDKAERKEIAALEVKDEDAIRKIEEHYAKERDDLLSTSNLWYGQDVGADLTHARSVLESVGKKPKASQAALERYSWMLDMMADHNILQPLLESGVLSQEMYDYIRGKNPSYIPALRRMADDVIRQSVEPDQWGGGQGKIHKKGTSGRTILNPIESMMRLAVGAQERAARNLFIRSMSDAVTFARDMFDGDPKYMARLATHEENKQAFTFWEDGEKRSLYVVDRFARKSMDDLLNQNAKKSPGYIRAVEKIANVQRAAITTAFDFMVRNMLRDTGARAILSETGASAHDFFRYLRDIVRQDGKMTEDMRKLQTTFGWPTGSFMRGPAKYRSEILRSMRKIASSDKDWLYWPAKLVAPYAKLRSMSEVIGRLHEFDTAYKKGMEKYGDETQARAFAAMKSVDLLNFQKMGSWVRDLNKITPFLGAGMTGRARFVEGMIRDPKRVMRGLVTYAVFGEIITRLVNSGAGETKEDREQMAAWRRDFFWNFKIPLNGWGYLSIPKPFEMGLIYSVAGRLVDRATGDKRAMEGFGKDAVNALLPYNAGEGLEALLGSLKPLLGVSIGYDTWRQKWIVPPEEQNLRMDLRHTEYGSRLGKAVQAMTGNGIDARNVDYLAQQLGGWGKLGVNLSDLGREDRPRGVKETALGATGLYARLPATDSRDARWITDTAKHNGLTSSKDYRDFKASEAAYYDAKDPRDKESARKRLLYQASQVREKWTPEFIEDYVTRRKQKMLEDAND